MTRGRAGSVVGKLSTTPLTCMRRDTPSTTPVSVSPGAELVAARNARFTITGTALAGMIDPGVMLSRAAAVPAPLPKRLPSPPSPPMSMVVPCVMYSGTSLRFRCPWPIRAFHAPVPLSATSVNGPFGPAALATVATPRLPDVVVVFCGSQTVTPRPASVRGPSSFAPTWAAPAALRSLVGASGSTMDPGVPLTATGCDASSYRSPCPSRTVALALIRTSVSVVGSMGMSCASWVSGSKSSWLIALISSRGVILR